MRVLQRAAIGAEVPLTIDMVTERANMILAYQRVMENKGAAGRDNLSVSAFARFYSIRVFIRCIYSIQNVISVRKWCDEE